MTKSKLHTIYNEEIVPALKEKFGYKSIMQVPKVLKVVVNVGYGRHHKDKNYIENVDKTLRLITGQKPLHNKVKKSISNFKIREGIDVGASVTLRGRSMYDFLYRTLNLTLPRVRDFRGLNLTGFDNQGNYSFGFKEQIAFPEVGAEGIDLTHGLEITVITNCNKPTEGEALLRALGFPFKEKKSK